MAAIMIKMATCTRGYDERTRHIMSALMYKMAALVDIMTALVYIMSALGI